MYNVNALKSGICHASVLTIALCTLPCAFGLNPRKALTQYSRTTWTQQHGLPQDTIRAIAQTSDGYLWLGTDEGLARFDGYEFVVFNRDHGDLPSDSVTTLAAAPDGTLWIGTPNGLTQYRDHRFVTYTRKDGLPDNSIGALLVDHAGVLWAVSGGNIVRMDSPGKFTTFWRGKEVPMRAARAITEDSHHTIYVAGNNSVVQVEERKVRLRLRSPTALDADFPSELQVDRAEHLWIVGVKGLIEGPPGGGLRRYGTREGLSGSFGLHAFLEDRDGNRWVGTDRGVARVQGGPFRKSRKPKAPTQARCGVCLRIAKAIFGPGAATVSRASETITLPCSAKARDCRAMNPTRSIRIGRAESGPALRTTGWRNGTTGRQCRSRPLKDANDRVYAIRETARGELLVSGRNGLTRIADTGAQTFVPPDPQGRKRVYDALEDAEGRTWMALPNGLGELKGGVFQTVIPVGPVMRDDSFVTVAQTSDGTLWAGTIRKGLWHVNGEQKQRFTTADGLSSDQIRSLYQDPEGTLWIGTFGGGLNAYRDGKFSTYRAKDGLLSDNVANIADDGESLWLSTPRGICRISKKQLLDFSAHKRSALQTINYGVGDGLRGAGVPDMGAGGGRHADRTIWFATSGGIAVYDPRESREQAAPPAVYLTEMSAEGASLDGEGILQVPPGTARLHIRYTSIHLGAPERVAYSYKLEGLDPDWVQAGNRREVDYNGLRQGRYRFRVRAELPGVAPSEASSEFDLLPHFYETAWFRVLGAIAFAALIWTVYKIREQQVRSRYAAVLGERARLAREVHDTLAQAFVGISSQLEVAEMHMPKEPSPARESVDLARRMAQHSLTEARRSVMDLRAEALDGHDLAFALDSGVQVWTAGSGVEVEADIQGETGDLPEDVSHHVLRIAQEAVANVVKHAHANKINLTLRKDPKKLTLNVRDNGCGFEPNGAFRSGNGHFGIMGMRERAERLGGELRLESAPGKGTLLDVLVPLP